MAGEPLNLCQPDDDSFDWGPCYDWNFSVLRSSINALYQTGVSISSLTINTTLGVNGRSSLNDLWVSPAGTVCLGCGSNVTPYVTQGLDVGFLNSVFGPAALNSNGIGAAVLLAGSVQAIEGNQEADSLRLLSYGNSGDATMTVGTLTAPNGADGHGLWSHPSATTFGITSVGEMAHIGPDGLAVTYGVAAASASIAGGVTASSITATATGNAQYSEQTSSGIHVLAGMVVAPGGFNGPVYGNVTGSASLNVLKAGDTMTGGLTVQGASGLSVTGASGGSFTYGLSAGSVTAPSMTITTASGERAARVVSVFDYMTAAQIADVTSQTASIDVSGAISNAMAALPAPIGGTVYFPAGKYKVASTITIDGTRTVRLAGAEGGTAGNNGTTLVFPSGVSGIIVNEGSGPGGGSAIERLDLNGTSKVTGHADGITISAGQVIVRDVTVVNFSRYGVYLYSPNDGCLIENVFSISNSSDGFRSGDPGHNGDSNINTFIHTFSYANGGWGYFEDGALGNTYIAPVASADSGGSFIFADHGGYSNVYGGFIDTDNGTYAIEISTLNAGQNFLQFQNIPSSRFVDFSVYQNSDVTFSGTFHNQIQAGRTASGATTFVAKPTGTFAYAGFSASGNTSGSPNAVMVVGDGTASQYNDIYYNGAATANFGNNFVFQSGGTQYFHIARAGRVDGGTSNNVYIRTTGATDLDLGTNDTTNLTVQSGGAVIVNGGPFNPSQKTIAQLAAITPAVGDVYSCSNCTNTYDLVVGTAAVIEGFREVGTGHGPQ